MLGKLLKYEWRGLRFPFLVMMIVLASTTVLTCSVIYTINPNYNEAITWYSSMALMFSIFLYYFGLIGCSIGLSLIIVIRFYNTCYTDQGYLTHTLPVTTRQILHAKLIAAFVADVLMVLAIAISLFLIIQVTLHHILSFIPEFTYADLMWEISRGIGEFEEIFGIRIGLYFAYLAIYSLIGTIANIVTLFGCVSLGQLYAKHRIIGAILAYFIVQFILQVLAYFASLPMYARMLGTSYNSDFSFFGLMSPTMNLMLFFSVALAVFMYFANMHMLTKRLNLE
ncbi:MAG: hypothetical protein K2P39_12465 [Lachnospiraceae bacterium]|nr:hypothetical protein [Lachnospiraceae bacterium]